MFFTQSGEPGDLLDIFKSQGMDSIRLRVWVNPAEGIYNSLPDTLAKAKRVKAAGMRLMIAFHYSDTWADPSHQQKPVSWQNYTFDQLNVAVAQHTRDTLSALRNVDITPEWVQVGNETSNGLLWDDGKASLNVQNYATLIRSAHDATKAIFPAALVVVHLDNCFDNALYRWNIDGLKANGALFDVIAASAYPTQRAGTQSWQITNASCLANLNDMVSRYGTDVMLAETGVPWDHPDAKAIVADLIGKVRSISNQKGLGVFYWEPQAYDSWKGYSMGAFDNSGRPAAAMSAFLD